MNRKRIIHITTLFFYRLSKYSNKAAENFDTESIHKFRVEYKKMRAFFRMLSHDSGRKIKITKQLRHTYAAAGALRDLQLQQQRLALFPGRKSKPALSISAHAGKKMKQLKATLLKSFLKNPVAACKKEIMPLLPASFTLSHFKRFIAAKVNDINIIISKTPVSDNGIHMIRKSLKDVYYNLRLYKNKEHEKLLPFIYKGNEKAFKELLTQLGDFQDKCVAIALLIKHQPAHPVTYKKIKTVWTNEKNILKQQLTKELMTAFLPQ